MALLDDIGLDIKRRIETFIALQEKAFSTGDQYAFWKATLACEAYGIQHPSWVSEELMRISGELIQLDHSNGNYRSYVSKEILNLDGNDRRRAERRQRDAKIWHDAFRMRLGGIRRKDIIDELEKKYSPIDNREIQKIIDSAGRSVCRSEEQGGQHNG